METNNKPAFLLDYIRSGLSEQTHFGFIKLIDKNGIIAEIGDDCGCVFYERSCAKPLQASLLVDNGIIDFFNLNDKEIAISCASHTGDTEHRTILKNYLKKIGCGENDLLCGIHQPLSKTEQKILILENKEPDVLHNNCSGKHTFMLAYCKKNGLDISTYPNIDHPLQKAIKAQIQMLCETKSELHSTKDGCGVPIWATTLYELAKGYLNLFTGEKYTKILNAFKANPYIIGGRERLDSEIINCNNNLIAKVGAGGLCVVVNTKKQQALIVKTCDAGLNARSLITIFALQQLNWLTQNQIQNSDIQRIFSPEIKTLHGETVGFAKPVFNLEKYA